MLQESPLQIDPSSWQSWKNDRVTQEVFRVLGLELEIWVSQLLEGYTLENPGSEIKDTAGAVGMVQGLKLILHGLDQELKEQWERDQEQLNQEVEERGKG